MKTKHIVVMLIGFFLYLGLSINYYLSHGYKIEYRDKNNITKNVESVEIDDVLLPVGYLEYDDSKEYWGYIDTDGNVAISLTYDGTYPFDENHLALVRKNYTNGPLYGLITTKEEQVLPITYDEIIYMGEGIYYYEVNDAGFLGKYNLGSRVMDVITNVTYDRVGSFSEELAYVVKDDKVGFIDNMGEVVIEYLFDEYEDFNFQFVNGNAFIYKDGKFGIIDTTGSYVKTPIYDEVMNEYSLYTDYNVILFDDYNEVPYRINDKWGYVSRNGEVLIEPQFLEAYPFVDSYLARVQLENEKYNFIDKEGVRLTQFDYYEANDFYNGYAMTSVGDEDVHREGLINQEGDIIIQNQYDFVGTVNQSTILTINQGHSIYYQLAPEVSSVGVSINYRFGDDMTDCRVMFASDHVGEGKTYVILNLAGQRIYNEITPKYYEQITYHNEQYIIMTAYEEDYNFEYYTYIDSHGDLLWKVYKED